MANRKRGTFSLPDSLQTTEKLLTKREAAQRNTVPSCPGIPPKPKRNFYMNRQLHSKAIPLYFLTPSTLSHLFNPTVRLTYLDQIFIKHKILGEGSFGVVYKVTSREDNELYAIKRSKTCISFHDRYAEVRNNEKIGIHKNIVQFFMAWEEYSDVYLKLEFCDMSLADYTNRDGDVPEEMLWNVLFDICSAFQYLHGKDFIHLDVKPGNICIKDGYFKLGDFGLLVDLKLPPKKCKSTLSDGDAKYLALEVLEGIYTPSCDIFGLGISLLECASDLQLPEHGPLWHQLRQGVLPTVFYNRVSLGLQVLVERMLLKEYSDRPLADKILKYRNLRDIAKRDLHIPRTNYALQFLEVENFNEEYLPPIEIPMEIFNNNNNDDELGDCTDMIRRSSIGRKSLQFDTD